MIDVAGWLRSLDLGEYTQRLPAITLMPRSLTLTAGDLRRLGVVSVGHRKRLLTAIAELRRNAAPSSDMAGAGAGLAALSEGERRQVSVLFADLSGHTRLTEEVDAEELHELMLGFFRAVDHKSRLTGAR